MRNSGCRFTMLSSTVPPPRAIHCRRAVLQAPPTRYRNDGLARRSCHRRKSKTRPKTPQLPVQNFPEYKLYPGFKDAASGIHESGSLARLLTRPQSASSLQYSPRVQPESAAALPPPSSSHFVEEMDQLLIETEEALAAVPAADALVERPWLNEAPAPAPVEAPAPATTSGGGGSRVTFQTDAVAAPAPAEVVNTTTYGWQTKIRSPQGKPMHVVLSQGGKPLEPSEVAEFSPDLVTLHGRAHFYLQTGVLPESLIPRSSGPVKPVSMTSAAIARRKKAEAERQKKEAERQLVESIVRRARRETANSPLKERPGSAGGDSSSMAHREWRAHDWSVKRPIVLSTLCRSRRRVQRALTYYMIHWVMCSGAPSITR